MNEVEESVEEKFRMTPTGYLVRIGSFADDLILDG
jgi:hypothetical protein